MLFLWIPYPNVKFCQINSGPKIHFQLRVSLKDQNIPHPIDFGYLENDLDFNSVRNFVSRQSQMGMKVGDRIHQGDWRGTICYIGKVEGVEGEWLGVDWDDESRGKHNGTFKGVQYFTARSEKSGSFIRPDKVSKGNSLMEAAQYRYGEGSNPKDFDGHMMGHREIEFVGMDKIESRQCDFTKLLAIVTDDMYISNAGNPEELKKNFPSCSELDLTLNLISDWEEIFRIIASLPRLKSIVISRNVLKTLSPSLKPDNPFRKIRALVLNDCGLTWENIAALLPFFPCLEDLGLCRNRVTEISYSEGSLDSLKSLDLQGNPLSSWKEVLQLSGLPKLTTLNVNNCGFTVISIPPDITEPFKSLDLLYVCENEIDSWEAMDEFAKFPSLSHILVRGNPVIKNAGSHQTGRQVVIAKIPQISILDRELIEPKERRGAEIDYLKMFGKSWVAAGGKFNSSDVDNIHPDFMKSHPRYITLVKKYGSPEESELVAESKMNSGVLQNRLVEITVINEESKVKKKLPSSMTVQKLKMLLSRLCKKDPVTIALEFESDSIPGIKVPLDNDFRQLAFYDLNDGDTIFVLDD